MDAGKLLSGISIYMQGGQQHDINLNDEAEEKQIKDEVLTREDLGGKANGESLEIGNLNRKDIKVADIDEECLENNISREEGLMQRKF